MTLLMGMIAKIAADNSFNKALNTVLLKELTKITGSEHSELIELAEKMQAENLAVTYEVFTDIIDKVFKGGAPEYIDDYLK